VAAHLNLVREPETYLSFLIQSMLFCRVSKVGRAAGVLENHEEGRRYAEHGLRAFVQNKTPEIMPGINKFFTDPK